jgi:hypothetical protein
MTASSSLRWGVRCSLLALALVPALAAQGKPDPLQALRAGFLNPPDSAKPMVRWWWFGPAVVKPEILKELQQMKANGIGGAELAFVYPEVLDDPSKDLKNLPFLSPEMLDAVNYAQYEGRKLGLRIDVTLCSGWPYGGPAITLDEAVTRLRTAEVAVAPSVNSVDMPKLAEGETLLAAAVVDGTPTPRPVRGQPPAPPTWNAASAISFTPAPGSTPIPTSSSPRVALFFIQSHTKQEVKRAAVDAEGYVLDPYSKQAVATHLEKVGEPLVKAFGATPPYAIFSDSLEAYGADWTPNLPGEFKRRRGYDLMEHLPELVGGGSPAADRVRHDYGKTLTELVNENYLVQINDWANAHHTKFRSQTYGEPAVNFSSQNLVALAEGEGPQWRAFSTLRWATSANHVFGHNVTSGETFTWLHSPVFRATPLDMKAEADIDFIMGENQLIFHGWPYSPPDHEVPEPGWSLYAAASFNDHNPWWPVEGAVNQYITRLSFLMRQGEPANQVAILLPEDDAWASFSPTNTTMTGALAKLITPELMSAILSAGYNVDFIDAEAIDKVGFGNHQVVVIPPTDRISEATLGKLEQWVTKGGGKAIAVGRAPTMNAEGKITPELTKLLQPLPFVPDNENLSRALQEETVPDLQLKNAHDTARRAVGFIHRKLTGGDLYFIVNTGNTSIHTEASLAAKSKEGELLDPETGIAKGTVDAGSVALDLAPYESRTFLFGEMHGDTVLRAGGEKPVVDTDLSADWNVNFIGLGKTQPEPTLTDWTADPSTLHYSGEAIYTRDFNLASAPKGALFLEVEGGHALPGAPNSGSAPEHVLMPNGLPDPRVTRTGPGMHAYFDPPIREAALVFINGQPAGALWHPPYRLDVSRLLKPGRNHIEIRVYNTALNAWSAEPPHDYGPLKAKYGDRFQMQDLDQVKPISSGILGTIKLVEMEPGK